jgi:hypothetical protein
LYLALAGSLHATGAAAWHQHAFTLRVRASGDLGPSPEALQTAPEYRR